MENTQNQEVMALSTMFIELDENAQDGSVKVTNGEEYDLEGTTLLIEDSINVKYTDVTAVIGVELYIKSGPIIIVKLRSSLESIASNEMRYIIDRLCKDIFANVISEEEDKEKIVDTYHNTLSVVRAIEILNRVII